MNMIKVLWCRFQECLRTFTMLLVQGSSQAALFRHLCDYVYGVRTFGNTKVVSVIFVPKYSKFNLGFKNAAKITEKVFYFWDNCFWISIVKLSLFRTGYFPSAPNVLKSSPKILHVNKRNFFPINCLGSGWSIWKRCCDADFISAWERLPCCLSKGSLKRHSLQIYLTTFSESANSKYKSSECHPFFHNVQNLI